MNPCGPEWLSRRLTSGEVVVIDGAMGTELESRGVTMHDKAWSGAVVVSHPHIVRAAHVDYIEAGAEVIITNTFASARHMLDPAGLGHRVRDINEGAVKLALDARSTAATAPVAVAGSICEWVHRGSLWEASAKLRESLREQSELLANAGVDLLTIEMGQWPEHTAIALEEALRTGLPVWAGLCCAKVTDRGGELGGFDPPHAPFDEILDSVVSQPVGIGRAHV